MLLSVVHFHLFAQEVTPEAPPSTHEAGDLPDGPEMQRFPAAVPLPPKEEGEKVVIDSDTQSERNGVYTLDGHVTILYGQRTIHADHIEYDAHTGDVTATGHLLVTGGPNAERMQASHGTMNVKTQTGRFYDVTGSVGLPTSAIGKVYTSGSPFLFTGRIVVRTGPTDYQIFDGSVTSCELPHPDWLLSAARFDVDDQKAKARNSTFHLLHIPLFYLPYVTHPTSTEARQSGFMIPLISSSSTKGIVISDEVYWAINRSMDLTVGIDYYSLRGWAQQATYRYKGRNNDFATAHYSGLQDRGYIPPGGVYTNQGGEDVTFSGRRDLTRHMHLGSDLEYLSTYTYREAFSNSFNQAVSSDILSIAYGSYEQDGFEASGRADRYQGLKRSAVAATPTTPAVTEEQVRIFHAPSLDLNTTDHRLGITPLFWTLESSTAGLKRVQPNFVSGGSIERLDIHPQLALPVSLANWHFLSSVGVRDTYYSRRLIPPATAPVPGQPPVEANGGLNRSDAEFQFEMRPPVLERTFTSGWVTKLFGGNDVRHTIEPSVRYRYVTGVDNFLEVLRFDDKDVVSDTNEIEYGVTQRLFVRRKPGSACGDRDLKLLSHINETEQDTQELAQCTTSERVQWKLAQKYFFDPTFGHAVQSGRRNIFDSTLSFSGVAFLTEPREISPLISRLRVQTSEKTDAEWDFDFDTGAKKFTSNNVFVDVHQGKTFAGLGYARLNAPGRSYVEGVSSSVANFSQLRTLIGWGSPTKPGFSAAGNAGFDLNQVSLQYAAVQASYNWNCCGLSIEYRKFELGAVRNESVYRFNFTLANIGTAGNLRRAERLF